MLCSDRSTCVRSRSYNFNRIIWFTLNTYADTYGYVCAQKEKKKNEKFQFSIRYDVYAAAHHLHDSWFRLNLNLLIIFGVQMNWNWVELYACVSMSDDIWRVPLWERLSGAYTLERKTLFEAHHSSCDHKCTDIVTCCKIGRFHSIVCCDAGRQYDELWCGVVYKGDESFIWLFN